MLSNASPYTADLTYAKDVYIYTFAHTLHVRQCARIYIEREEVCREDVKREREAGSNDQP